MTKPVKCDPALLRMARAALIEKLRSRLAPTWSEVEMLDSDMPPKAVDGFVDPQFVEAFGPGLSRVPDATLVNQALLLLIRQVTEAPEGEAGLPFFDDR